MESSRKAFFVLQNNQNIDHLYYYSHFATSRLKKIQIIMIKSPHETPHEPLFVLRRHRAPVLSCSFYPTYGSFGYHSPWPDLGKVSETRETNEDLKVSSSNVSSFLTTNVSSIISSSTYAHYFLTGDADGVCILWDLRFRKPVLSFQPVLEGERQRKGLPKELSNIISYPMCNQGVLSVGFFPSTITVRGNQFSKKLLSPSDDHEKKSEDRLRTDIVFDENAKSLRIRGDVGDRRSEEDLSERCNGEAEGGTLRSTCTGRIGLVQRFALHRRPRTLRHTGSPDINSSTCSPSRTPNLNEDNVVGCVDQLMCRESVDKSTPPLSLYFFTQCRNQHLYVWEFVICGGIGEGRKKEKSIGDSHLMDTPRGSTTFSCGYFSLRSPSLLYVLPSPQCGFCQVSCAYSYEWDYVADSAFSVSSQKGRKYRRDFWDYKVSFFSYFSIPQEGSDGVVDLWCGHFDSGRSSLATSASLSLSSTKIEWKNCNLLSSSSSPLILTPLLAQGNRRGFSLAPSFKGGMIMGLDMSRNAVSLAGAFESGHISLFQYRCTSEDCHANHLSGFPQFRKTQGKLGYNNVNGRSTKMLFSCDFKPHLLAVLRAFAEPCITCAWESDLYWWKKEWKYFKSGSPNIKEVEEEDHLFSMSSTSWGAVVAASAEGMIHCYHSLEEGKISSTNKDGKESTVALHQDTLRGWSLRWALKFPKGIGQLRIQGEIVVTGGWDSTIRLLSLTTGRVISILSHHREAVNGLSLCDATLYYLFSSGSNGKCETPIALAPPFSTPRERECTVLPHPEEVSGTSDQLGKKEVGEIISEALARGAAEALTSFGFDIHFMRSGGGIGFCDGADKTETKGRVRSEEPFPDSFNTISGQKVGGVLTSLSSHINSDTRRSEICLYFASVSKDLTIAIWNVDFRVLSTGNNYR